MPASHAKPLRKLSRLLNALTSFYNAGGYMAFNGMKVIHSGLGNRLRYIMNPAKTDNGLLIAGINTTPLSALEDMMDTKQRFGKLDKRQGYHIMQSFKPGEIEPDTALRFGMEFIDKYLDNRFEGVAAVHTDKAHVHVHIIFNSVSYIDGKKYHAAKGEYLERIREMCDEQCRAWGLSVIDGNPTIQKKSKSEYRDEQAGRMTWRDHVRRDIDMAIEGSIQWSDFISIMEKQGYEIRNRNKSASFALRAPGMKRFVRLRSLSDEGEGYSYRDLELRMRDNLWHIESVRTRPFPYPEDEALDKFIGTQADYYNITQQMKRLIDRQHMKYSPALRAEIRKLEQWNEDMDFQTKYKIDSLEGLRECRTQTQSLIDSIAERRKPLYKERQLATRNNDVNQVEFLSSEIQKYKSCLAALRKEIHIANRIEDRLLNKVPAMLAAREAQQEIKERQEREERERKRAYHQRDRGER